MISKITSPEFLVFILFLFVCNNAIAQDNSDSLRSLWTDEEQLDSIRFNALNEYHINNGFAQPDSVIHHTAYHYELAERKNNKLEMAKSLNERSFAFYAKSNYDSSEVMLHKALVLIKDLKDPSYLAKQYVNFGNVYRGQNKYQEAIRYYSLSLENFRKENLESVQADILNNLGLVYYDINNFDLALEYLKLALDLYKKIGVENDNGNIWLNIGAVYYSKGNYAEAIVYTNKSLPLLEKSKNTLSIADNYMLAANSNLKLGNLESALAYAKKSLKLNEDLENEENVIENLTFIANFLFEDNPDEANKIAQKALNLIKPNSDYILKVNLYKLLYKCYKRQNNFSKSLEMHEKYAIYNDSLLREKNNIAIIREAIQNEYETKLYNNQLKNENEQTQLKLRQVKKTYIIIFISLFLIAGIFFYAQNKIIKNRKKRGVLLKELEELKKAGNSPTVIPSNTFQLDRNKLEKTIKRSMNETDWVVLNILVDDPVISNKEIAEKAFLSVDGIGSSLRRMYDYFEIKESKYKKISLLLEAIKISNSLI